MIRKSLFLPLLALLPLWLLACATTSQPQAAGPDSFVFLHITDPQVGMYKALDREEDYSIEARDFARALTLVEELQPDFVLIGGDMVEWWSNEEQIALFMDFAEQLEQHTTVYLQPGNHDHPPTDEGVAFYRDLYGPDYYSVSHRGSHLILLNSNLIEYNDRLPEHEQEQWEWLVEELKTASELSPDHTFVFVHHPFFLYSPDEDDTYFNIRPETRELYLTLFEEHGVDAIFAGHYHREAGGFRGDMEMIVTSSLGTPLGNQPAGLRRVVVNPSYYEHEFLPLP